MNPYTELKEEIQTVQPHTVEQVMLMIKHFESKWNDENLPNKCQNFISTNHCNLRNQCQICKD